MSVEHLMFLSALIVGTLGLAHLVWTFLGPEFPESGTRTWTGVT